MAGKASCPHGCARCRAIEAGYAGRGLTPAEFLEIFSEDLIEQPRRNGHSPETLEAAEAVEAAEIAWRLADDQVGKVIAALRGRSDPQLEAALVAATEARGEADDALRAARRTYHRLARADSFRRQHEEYLADQGALAEARRERTAERTGVPPRLSRLWGTGS
jgi:hypothetical protein